MVGSAVRGRQEAGWEDDLSKLPRGLTELVLKMTSNGLTEVYPIDTPICSAI